MPLPAPCSAAKSVASRGIRGKRSAASATTCFGVADECVDHRFLESEHQAPERRRKVYSTSVEVQYCFDVGRYVENVKLAGLNAEFGERQVVLLDRF